MRTALSESSTVFGKTSRLMTMKTSSPRIQWIDTAKLIGIYLVILGHMSFHNLNVNIVIFSFHMPLFFFLSGVTAKKECWKDTLRKSFNVLIVPYVCFYLINFAKTYFWRPERVEGSFVKALLGMIMGVGFDTPISIMVVPPLWFLAGLFCCKMIFSFAHCICESKGSLVSLVFGIVFVSIACFLSATDRYLPFSLGPAFLAYPFFAIGNAFSTNIIATLQKVHGSRNTCIFAAIMLLSFAANIFLTSLNGHMDVNLMMYGKSLVLFYITAFTGITAVVILSSIIKTPSFLNLFAQNTIIILAFHSMVTKLVLIPLTKLGLAQIGNDRSFLMPSVSIAMLVALGALLLSYFPITIVNKFFPWMLGRKREYQKGNPHMPSVTMSDAIIHNIAAEKVNVILSDREAEACETFRRGLEEGNGEKWTVWACVSNKGRTRGYNVIRYFKYLFFPLRVYWRRKRFAKIFAWQVFYAVGLGFYSRLFHGEMDCLVAGKNLIYRDKKGWIGRLYLSWLRYAAGRGRTEYYLVSSAAYQDYLAERVGVEPKRLAFMPFGKEDFTQTPEAAAPRTENAAWKSGSYLLALGRSNRDYDWLVNALEGTGRKLHIISDEYRPAHLPSNVRVSNNLSGLQVLPSLRDAAALVFPIADGRIDAGETVLLMGFMFAKPVVVTGPSCLATDYLRDGENGLVVEKDPAGAALNAALARLETEPGLATRLGTAARAEYEAKYSEEEYGRRVGAWLRNLSPSAPTPNGETP